MKHKPKDKWWSEEFKEIMSNTIIDGGFDNSKEDNWLDQNKTIERIGHFVSKVELKTYEKIINVVKAEILETLDIITPNGSKVNINENLKKIMLGSYNKSLNKAVEKIELLKTNEA